MQVIYDNTAPFPVAEDGTRESGSVASILKPEGSGSRWACRKRSKSRFRTYNYATQAARSPDDHQTFSRL